MGAASERLVLWLWLAIIAGLLTLVAAGPAAAISTESGGTDPTRSTSTTSTTQLRTVTLIGRSILRTSLGVARLVSGRFRAAKVTTGGIGPVLKGQAGVARAIGELEAEGAEVLGRGEITLSTPVGRTRIDLAQRTSAGELRFVEVKNGPSAAPNANQRKVFDYIRRYGGTPVGRRARQAGFEPGQPIGPTAVDLRSYGG